MHQPTNGAWTTPSNTAFITTGMHLDVALVALVELLAVDHLDCAERLEKALTTRGNPALTHDPAEIQILLDLLVHLQMTVYHRAGMTEPGTGIRHLHPTKLDHSCNEVVYAVNRLGEFLVGECPFNFALQSAIEAAKDLTDAAAPVARTVELAQRFKLVAAGIDPTEAYILTAAILS